MKRMQFKFALLAIAACVAGLCGGSFARAQGPSSPPDGPGGMGMHGAPWEAKRPPMERAFHGGPGGRWWDNPELAQKLALSTDQQKKMDDIFQQSRLKLIDANASLQKEEAILEPLISADQPEEPKVLAQIDRVAQARAELEKSNARMLLGLRRVLTPEQWKKLQEQRREGHGRGGFEGRHGGPGQHEGPGAPGGTGPGAPGPGESESADPGAGPGALPGSN
jgi:Spy/CpxP family protein refolding chaperone